MLRERKCTQRANKAGAYQTKGRTTHLAVADELANVEVDLRQSLLVDNSVPDLCLERRVLAPGILYEARARRGRNGGNDLASTSLPGGAKENIA